VARFLLFTSREGKILILEMVMQQQETQVTPYYDNLRHFLHDLAQPLATVTGLIDLMLLELDERDKMFREVQLISQQLEKVIQIIGEIRRIAQLAAEREASRLTPPPTPES